MENFFHHQIQFLKQFDVKAQENPKRKRKWLLSRQYLQPLNEPDEEESSQDDQEDSPTGYKKKLKCAYEAAKYGMKEGVLTGVFLGGCWGIFKQLGDNFTLGFLAPARIEGGHGGEKSSAGIPSHTTVHAKSRTSPRAETRMGSVISSEKERTSAPKDSYMDQNIATYMRSVSTLREKSPEKNYYNASKNRLVFANSKLPVRSDKHVLPLRSGGAGIYGTERYHFRRSGEKVEIVGYAFIQTTGSITGANSGSGSIKSSGSDSPKRSESNTREEKSSKSESSERSRRRSRESETENLIVSETMESLKSESQSLRSGHQSMRTTSSPVRSPRPSIKSSERLSKSGQSSSGSFISSNAELVQSQTSERGTEQSRSTLPDVVEETQNVTPVGAEHSPSIKTTEDTSGRSSTKSGVEYQHPRPLVSDSYRESSLDASAYEKQESRTSGMSRISYTDPPSTHRTGSNTPGFRSRKSRKTADTIFLSRAPSDSENIHPNPKKTGSILVNIDAISNGFTSPKSGDDPELSGSTHYVAENTKSLLSASPPQSMAHSVTSRSSEMGHNSTDYVNSSSKTFSDGRILTDAEDQDRYKVESRPVLNRSYVSETRDEEKSRKGSSNLSQNMSYVKDTQHGRYTVDSSPRFDGSYTSETPEGKSRSDSGSFYKNRHVSETRDEDGFRTGETPPYIKSLISETQDEKIYSPESNLTSNRSYVSEDVRRYSLESSLISKRSYVSETQDERSFYYGSSPPYDRSYVSETHDEGGYTSENSPIYTKTRSSEVQEEERSRPGTSPIYSKLYISETEDLDRRSGGSRYSASLFGKDSSGVRSHASAVSDKERRSGGSPAHVRSSTPEESPMGTAGQRYSAALFSMKSSGSPIRQESGTKSHLGGRASLVGGGNRTGSGGGGASKQVGPPAAVSEKVAAPVAAKKKEETAKKSEKSSRGFSFLSALNENIIVLSACNCAIVLGVLCSVISTTRASLA